MASISSSNKQLPNGKGLPRNACRQSGSVHLDLKALSQAKCQLFETIKGKDKLSEFQKDALRVVVESVLNEVFRAEASSVVEQMLDERIKGALDRVTRRVAQACLRGQDAGEPSHGRSGSNFERSRDRVATEFQSTSA